MVEVKFTIKRIIKEVGCAHLKMWRVDNKGAGYYVFEYSKGTFYETESVHVYRLWHMKLSSWVDSGKDFVQRCEANVKEQAT